LCLTASLCSHNRPNVLQVHAPGVNVDQYVIEEDEDEATDEILEHVIHQCLERGGALVNPKGMTKNSKCLWCFLKVVLSTSASFIRTWW
jgi:hypothetical protein